MSTLPYEPKPLMGTVARPDGKPFGFYAVARCDLCADIHFAVETMRVERAGDGVRATVMMSATEARQLAAELLALAEGH